MCPLNSQEITSDMYPDCLPQVNLTVNLDHYLRPVDAMVFFKASAEILLLSEREADGALQSFRSVSSGASAPKDDRYNSPEVMEDVGPQMTLEVDGSDEFPFLIGWFLVSSRSFYLENWSFERFFWRWSPWR